VRQISGPLAVWVRGGRRAEHVDLGPPEQHADGGGVVGVAGEIRVDVHLHGRSIAETLSPAQQEAENIRRAAENVAL